MTENPHLATPLLVLGALADARVRVLLLHGRDQDGAAVADDIARRIGLPGVAYAVPLAADRSWYPASFLAPLADNQPRLDFAVARVAKLVDELAPVAVIGFSQGACLACEVLYRRRAQHRTRALVAFTGGLIGPAGTSWASGAALAGLPVLISGGTADPWVPHGRMRETAAAFERLGARVATHFTAAGDHAVSDGEIAAARALLVELGA